MIYFFEVQTKAIISRLFPSLFDWVFFFFFFNLFGYFLKENIPKIPLLNFVTLAPCLLSCLYSILNDFLLHFVFCEMQNPIYQVPDCAFNHECVWPLEGLMLKLKHQYFGCLM